MNPISAFAVQRQTGVVPFPLRYDAKLTYGVNVTLTTAGSSNLGVMYRFRLNSLYDPDVTGTGHQPYQYDQLSPIYRQYLVRKAHIDLTFSDPTADGLWVGWAIVPDGDTGDTPTSLSLEDYLERPMFRCMPCNNTGAQTVTCRMTVPNHAIFGLTEAQYAAEPGVYGAAYNANPAQTAYLQVFLVDPTALVSTHSIRISGRLVYDSQLFGYIGPNQS